MASRPQPRSRAAARPGTRRGNAFRRLRRRPRAARLAGGPGHRRCRSPTSSSTRRATAGYCPAVQRRRRQFPPRLLRQQLTTIAGSAGSTSRPAPSLPADGHGAPVSPATRRRPRTTATGPEWRCSYGRLAARSTPSAQARCDPPNGDQPASHRPGDPGRRHVDDRRRWPHSAGTGVAGAATLDVGDHRSAHQLRHRRQAPPGTCASARRSRVEIQLPLSSLSNGNARRWVPGTRKILFQGHDPNDPQLLRDQMYTYDTDSGELEQLTLHPQGTLRAA